MATSPSASSAWTFAQQGGSSPKTLRLTGWSQPFGRPRQGSILDAGIRIKRQIKYMAGVGVEPLVTAMGASFPPWEMHGRWMDQAIGYQGAALLTMKTWKDFVADQRIVLASWNNLIAYRIFIYEMPMRPESQAEVVWEMKADALSDLSQAPPVTIAPVRTPKDMSSELQQLAQPATMQSSFNLAGFAQRLSLLNSQLSDALTLAIGNVNAQVLAIASTADAISDFASAPSAALGALSSGLSSLQTNLATIRACTDNISQQLSLQQQLANAAAFTTFSFSAADVITFQSAKIDADAANTASLALIADILSIVQTFTRGKPKTSVVAQDGQTWEQLAVQLLGSVDGVQALRDMNGVRGGTLPVAGRKYQVPSP